MYEIVLIDADNTLFDYNKSEKYALTETLREFCYKGNIFEAHERFKDINNKLWLEFEQGKVAKAELRTERFRRLFNEFKIDGSIDIFSEQYLKKLGEGSFLIEDAEWMCKYLSEKYSIIIVTNGIKEVQLSRLKKSSIKKYIAGIVVSDDIGVNKPDAYIFEYALSLIKHKDKKSVIMIGDSLTSDIQGGINFGIDTCWLNFDKIENYTDIRPKYQVDTLKGLLDIL